MSAPSTKPPSGMRDFLAPDVLRRRHVTGIVTEVYESFGFLPLETPSIENLSTLLGKYGAEGDQLLYRLLHRRERLQRALDEGDPAEADLANEGLRYDLTVPLARVVANYRNLPRYYKRYQIQPVWRADRPAKGRFREFYQCDVDITGTASMVADAEVCAAVAVVLQRLGFADFKILVNHRALLRALVTGAGIDESLEGTTLVALDKLEKIGEEGVARELAERGIGETAAARLLGKLKERELDRFEGTPGADALTELFELAAAGPAAAHLEFEPCLARGLSYYTGPIFEIAVEDLPGSVGGGGRYDELIGMFSKRDIPAVGFSLGLERILLVMEQRTMFPDLATGPDVLVCRFPDVAASEAIRLATRLRASGLRVEVHPETPQLGKQLQYASTIGARHAAILGASEVAAGTVALKHLASGKQLTIPQSEAKEALGTLSGDPTA